MKQAARKLLTMVYGAIESNRSFQNDYRLKDQSIGAAISVMGNIPEGFVRRSNREFIQFLFISVSSAAELQSHMYAALDQHYVTKDMFDGIYQQGFRTSFWNRYLFKGTPPINPSSVLPINVINDPNAPNGLNDPDALNQINQRNQTDQIDQSCQELSTMEN